MSITLDNTENNTFTVNYSDVGYYGNQLYDIGSENERIGNTGDTYVNHYLLYVKPSFTFSEQVSSSDRMNEIKNTTQYTFFKKNSKPNEINDCNIPIKNISYESRYNIVKGSAICNMNNIMKN